MSMSKLFIKLFQPENVFVCDYCTEMKHRSQMPKSGGLKCISCCEKIRRRTDEAMALGVSTGSGYQASASPPPGGIL